jgi:2-C-methyl-D-erythritol 4-phosphate cytidylyltransferase
MADRPVIAVILAAGESSRMGGGTPKVLLPIAGKLVLEWSVAAFQSTPDVGSIVVVAHPAHITAVSAVVATVPKVEAVIPGGATRSASVREALKVIAAPGGVVLVHDAARPLITGDSISALVAALDGARAATIAEPARDTILTVDGGHVADIPDRARTWHAQTPQGFSLETLRAAYEASGPDVPDFTDDCSIVRRFLPNVPIAVVAGAGANPKITSASDLPLVEKILADRA